MTRSLPLAIALCLGLLAAACGADPTDSDADGSSDPPSVSTREDTVATADPERSSDTPDLPATTPTSTIAGTGDPTEGATDPALGNTDTDSTQRTDKVLDDGPVVVVAHEGVLGWWDGTWHRPGDGDVPTDVGDQFEIITLDEDPSIAIGGGVVSTCVFDDQPGVVVGITGPTEWFDPVPIAVHNAADPRPRPVVSTAGGPDTYNAIAAEFLASRGLDSTGSSVVQFVRADIEGDGVDETFLVIERRAPAPNPPQIGDHSIAVMRRIASGQVETVVLEESIVAEPAFEGEVPLLDVARIAAIVDLDADGDYELALNVFGREFSATVVYEPGAPGAEPTTLLEVGCGV